MTIARRIQKARTKQGLSQAQLAGMVGVSRGACGQWESGISQPSVEKLSKLAVLLEIAFEWLTTERGDMEYIPAIHDKKASKTDIDFFMNSEQRKLLTEFGRLSETKRNAMMELLRLL